MKKISVYLLLTALLCSPLCAQEQSGFMSGKNALSVLGQQFGQDKFKWIVEMRGFNGIPQPREWTVVVYDPSSIYLLNEYWAGEGRGVNEGPYDGIFPDKSPIGYIDFDKLKLDSAAAFTVAEAAARKARVGFDSLNYVLRSREYSNEPLWVLSLVDANQLLVGKVHISGSTGSILRTVWINREGPSPKIIDSSAPGNQPLAAAGQNGGGGQDPTRGELYPSSKPKNSATVPERRVRGPIR